MNKLVLVCWLLCLLAITAHAELIVIVAEPKVAGSKTVVKLELKNAFTNKVESARAQVFIINSQGKVVGRAAQWVIGGTKDKPALAPAASTTFHFVIATEELTTTNLTAKVSFTRIILEGGKLADVAREVTVTAAAK